MSDLSIHPVKVDEDKIPVKHHPHLPSLPALGQIVAPSHSGKSTLIMNLIYRLYPKDTFDRIYLVSPTAHGDATMAHLVDDPRCTLYDSYHDGIIAEIKASQKRHKRPRACLIYDDCVGELTRSSAASSYVTKSRHDGIIMTLFSTQSYRAFSNVVRSNASFLISFKLPNDQERDKMVSEYGGLFGEKTLAQAYTEATQERFSFLFVDIKGKRLFSNFTEQLFPVKR